MSNKSEKANKKRNAHHARVWRKKAPMQGGNGKKKGEGSRFEGPGDLGV